MFYIKPFQNLYATVCSITFFHIKKVLCGKEVYFRIFLSAKHGFVIFYTEWPSINVTACLTSRPLISRFSNKSIISFTAVRPFSVTS